MLSYCAGDSAAFRELFTRYAPLLRRLLARFRLPEEQLNDLVQQTFLHLHRARLDFDATSELRPWLFTIAFNLAREQLRRTRRKPESELDENAERRVAHQPADQYRADLRRDLTRALQKLSEDQREVVRLHFIEDLSFEEIGARLGASTGAVRVRAHRGYGALRKLLSNGNQLAKRDIDEGGGS